MHASQTTRSSRDHAAKVKQLRSKLLLCEKQMASLQKHMDSERPPDPQSFLPSPISALPVELLSKMFLFSVDAESDPDTYTQDAYWVSHVCSYWRNVAISTPEMWTGPLTVPVSFEREPEKESFYVEGLQAWLARSEPLAVSICLEGFRSGSNFAETSSLITQELAKIVPRWRSLQMRQRVLSSFVEALAEGGSFSSLEELELETVVPDSTESADPSTILAFRAAPRLHKLTMNIKCQVLMPWCQLTHLSLRASDHAYEPILDILTQCTSLARLSILLSALYMSPPSRPAAETALPHLTSLSLTIVGLAETFVVPFLDYVSAPILESMIFLCETMADAQWDETAFSAFQSRSPNISRLEIGGNSSPISSPALISVLTHSPRLTHLKLDDCLVEDAFLQAISIKEDDNLFPLVPRLSSLTLTGLVQERFTEEVLRGMVQSRWRRDNSTANSTSGVDTPGRCLQTVVLGDDSAIFPSFTFSPTFQNAMKELQATTGFPSSVELTHESSSGQWNRMGFKV
ncbi:hypothetical protein R3P38DRAFT_2867138 [Favolaschia claudopus]|uniref:F-box domain-containing protein n=1 Tax=Favolaschia claudopus TaxID=2862362 RepID=A0AAW0D5Z8_9AGAR